MTFYTDLTGTAMLAWKEGSDKIKAKAAGELGLNTNGLVIRMLRPEDLGSTYPWWVCNLVATNTWTVFTGASTYTVADNRFCYVGGVYFNGASGTLHQIRITRQQSTTRYWVVSPLRGFISKTGYADDGWTVDQNTMMTIEGIASSVSTLTDVDFVGLTAEKRGLLINPTY
jgi:hypothetical protein